MKMKNEIQMFIRLFNLRRTILSNYNQNAIQNAIPWIRLLNMSRQIGDFSLQFEVQNFITSEYFILLLNDSPLVIKLSIYDDGVKLAAR